MKKTLIALAVAASATVSGSVMAWDVSGSGNPVVLSGLLTPQDNTTPWEVAIGPAVTTLNADIKKGQKDVYIITENAIPVLGIRTVKAEAFQGQPGIAPQINYGGAVDVDNFAEGVTTLTLDVKNTAGVKIGTVTSSFFAGAGVSRLSTLDEKTRDVYSAWAEGAFEGGLATNSDGIVKGIGNVLNRVSALAPEIVANFNQQYASDVSHWRSTDFSSETTMFSAFYGSGIEEGKSIRITLEQPAGSDAIDWKADLPITVSYQ
ncbi:TPA: fimbrial protein [Salmonella enterica]|nr:fimbrial protein [Salmonella enterica]